MDPYRNRSLPSLAPLSQNYIRRPANYDIPKPTRPPPRTPVRKEQVPNVVIKYMRPLTLDDIPKLPLTDKTLDKIGLIDYEEDEELMEDNYVIGDIEINGKKYTMIHGFPGENASGVIYNQDEMHFVGQYIDAVEIDTIPLLWYSYVTRNGSNYSHDWWYASPHTD